MRSAPGGARPWQEEAAAQPPAGGSTIPGSDQALAEPDASNKRQRTDAAPAALSNIMQVCSNGLQPHAMC